MRAYGQLLGMPHLHVGETWYDFPLTKASALLVYLACRGDWVSRDELLYLFYPDSPEVPARSSLRQLLTSVRRLPYSEGLESEDTRLRWQVETDIAAFKGAILQEKWPKALELYKGELLQGFHPHDLGEFDNWLSLERQTLHAFWRKASLSLATELATTERYSLAAEVLATLHKADPFDEEVLRVYLENLYSSGQKIQALEIFTTFKNMLHHELSSDPEAHTLELITLIQQDQPLNAMGFGTVKTRVTEQTKPRHNLSVQPTEFVGRETEKAKLAELFADPSCRLLTLVAPGGMGKTRLAIEVAKAQLENFEGICFASFAAIDSADLMVYTLAEALELSLFGAKSPKEQVLDYLKNRKMLLVLDNLEHLLSGIDLISDLLTTAPEIRILATSRERLGLQSEHLFDLYGLTVPDDTSSLQHTDALHLFAERAKHNHLDFDLKENLQAVTKICQLVGGMPLAIELAASWSRLLSPEEIAKELEHNLDILATSTRDLPERHHKMQSVFEVSWQRLSADEQTALRKLSVFHGGFTKEAAQAVAQVDLTLLLSLVNKSFVWRDTTGRFSQHPLMLQYLRHKANNYPEEKKQNEEKHGLYYLELFREKTPGLRTQTGKETLETLEKELPNLRTAWDWMVREKRVNEISRNARVLSDFFLVAQHGHEGADRFKRVAETLDKANPKHHAALGYALIQQVWIESEYNIGNAASKLEMTRRGLELLEPLQAYSGILQGKINLSAVARGQGEFAKQKDILTSALDLARTYGRPQDISAILEELVMAERELDSFAEASASIERILEELRELGDTLSLSFALTASGAYLVYNDCLAEGEKLLLESLELSRQHTAYVIFTLADLARLAYKRRDFREAERLVKEAYEEVYESASKPHSSLMKATTLAIWGRVKLVQGQLDEAERLMLEGLKIAWNAYRPLAISHSLVLLAELNIAQGQVEQGVHLLSFLSRYQIIEKRDRDEVTKLLETAKAQLSERDFTQAQEESKSLTLEEIVTGILNSEID
jgi:DNA-binding SARP family transcriptional activator